MGHQMPRPVRPRSGRVEGDHDIARRRFLRVQAPVQRTRINHTIRISPIRLIDAEGQQVGVVDTPDAMRMAQDAGRDLVEINPETRPPICKIMDYGKYKYELSKRDTKQTNKGNEIKEIRLGRSVKIGVHDVQIRVDQARRFLIAGHKVQLTQRFRGREMMHKELGLERLYQICEDLGDVAKVEMAPRWLGRQASIVLAPDKAKVEAFKREKAKDEEDLEKLEAEVAAQNAAIAEAEGDDDDDDAPSQIKQQPPAKKGRKDNTSKKDDRIVDPVQDEIADLLGEV